jgi:hypothetical protein
MITIEDYLAREEDSLAKDSLERLRQWADDLNEDNASAAGLLAWAAHEIATGREQAFADACKAVRRKYAQAWADATGSAIYEHEFTTGFIKERVKNLYDAACALVEVTGEVSDEFGFIPCPVASLSGHERDKISPWIKEEWSVLDALVNHDDES